MSERDDIRRRVQAFKAYQDKLALEREAHVDRLIQQIRLTLAEMRASFSPPLVPHD